MAGYISRKSADRWNRAAGIVEGAGAGSHFVRGLYRQPKQKENGVEPCAELGGLLPGSYPAVAFESIAGGETGLVVYDGNSYEAVNQSGCDVIIGDRVGLHISPNCQAFFVPCVCCSPPPDPDPTCAETYPCCRTPFVYCLRIPFMDTPTIPKTYFGTASLKDTAWTIPGPLESPFTIVCDGQQLFLSFEMTCCNDGTPDVTWEARNLADEVVASGSFSVAGLCDEPPTIERHTLLLPNGCSMFISFGTEFVDELCGNPEPPPEDCCDQSRWFCLNGVSQQLAFDGGTYTWDVSACCETTASFKITMSCNPVTGIPTMGWEYTAGVVFDSGNINVVELCDDTSPKIYTFPGITCFLQMIVSFVEFECSECTGGGTTITTPPPPGP